MGRKRYMLPALRIFVAFCVSCGEKMEDGWMACPKCGTPKGGESEKVVPQFSQQPIAIQVREPKSKGIAFILNFLIAGVGHMYLDNIDRGLPVAIISTLCALIIIVTAIAIYKCCFKGFVARLRAIFCPFFIFINTHGRVVRHSHSPS